MAIVRKKPFFRGIVLLISFVIMLALILLPLIPDSDGARMNGLEYADEVFNELSKGSSYFIPQAKEAAQSMEGKNVYLLSPLNSERQAEMAHSILEEAGAHQLKVEGNKLAFQGDLGKILLAAVQDSDLMYNNNGKAIQDKYGNANPLDITAAWWHVLNPCIRELQKQNKIAEAKAVDQVLRRAVEPGNNFYGIAAKKVSGNILLLCGLLLFYICYTIWYGFGIYEIFDGIGLMKAAEKAEETEMEDA